MQEEHCPSPLDADFVLIDCIDDFLDRKVKQHERECVLVCFLARLFLCRNKLWNTSSVSGFVLFCFSPHFNSHFIGKLLVCGEFKS